MNNNVSLNVYDTLVIYGDFTIENNGFLTINAGGMVIVYGNVTANNNVNIDLSSYFVVFGDYTQNQNSDITAPNNDTLLYVTGTTSCNKATCLNDTLVGGAGDITNNPDIGGVVSSTSAVILPVNPVICNGGSVTLSIRNDGSNYQWSKDGTVIPGATSYTFDAIQTGSYDVSFDVGTTSYNPTPVTVTQNTFALSLTTVTDVTCNGGSDGAIDISPTGGANPYSYSWYNGATTEDLTAVSAGTYSVVATDDGGCSATLSNLVVNEPSPVLPSLSGADTVCQGDVQVYTTEASMSNYSWNISSGGSVDTGSGTNSATVTWSGTDNQTLSVSYTDTNGCPSASATMNVKVWIKPVTGPVYHLSNLLSLP